MAGSDGGRFSFFRGWVPAALVAWFAIFGTYEVVERAFLRGADPDVLHVLHILRGTLTSFLLAGLVAWYILRRRPAAMEVPATGLRTIVAETEGRELTAQAIWIIRLRWLAVVGVLATVSFARFAMGAITPYSAIAVYLIAGVMILYNILFTLIPPRELAGVRAAFAQVFLDLAALTLMLYFTGGIQNPFFLFYIFHVVIAGILLGRRETYLVTAGACAFFTGMAVLQQLGVARAYPLELGLPRPGGWIYVGGILGAFVVTIWCTAYFTTTIVDKLRRRGAQILEANDILSQERTKTEDILRSVGAAMIILDLDYRVVWANDIAKQWFGPDLSHGALCWLGLWKLEGMCDSCPVPSVVRTGQPGTYQRTIHRRSYLVTSNPIRSANGRIEQVLALIQDVTPMKEMEIQLVQAGKMAAIGQLAAGIAHEINNPLATVASSAEILHESVGGEPQAARHLKKIEDNVYRCKEIIQNLLSFARKDDSEIEDVDLSRLLEETVQLVEGTARARERAIARSYPRDFPVRSRPRLIQQIVLNLLLNALDAMGPGGKVTVTAERAGTDALIDVADTGPGIAPEHLERIFEPFFTTKPAGKGTGLGLYLCREFATALGGSIAVQSCPGQGATFQVRIPTGGK